MSAACSDLQMPAEKLLSTAAATESRTLFDIQYFSRQTGLSPSNSPSPQVSSQPSHDDSSVFLPTGETHHHRRLHTFSRAMYDKLLQHHDFVELQTLSRGRVAFLCERDRNSVLVIGGIKSEVDCASQLLCNIIPEMCDVIPEVRDAKPEMQQHVVPKHPWEDKEALRWVPKHPWEQQIDHISLAQKISLPPDSTWHHQGSITRPHCPISRTVSDSHSLQKKSKATFASSRRKLESEDSSYDSDHEGLEGGHQLYLPSVQVSRSHDDVSRTPSETLRTEFEEYVTVKQHPSSSIIRSRERSPALLAAHKEDPSLVDTEALDILLRDPGYNSKVEFALRLGYSETMLQSALIKLGPSSAENQILEELIKLQKSKPSNNMILENRSSLSPQTSLPSEFATDDDLLPIVIDGSNVAMSHGNKDMFSCRGIRICVNWFQSRGHKDVTVFVPMWRKETSRPDTPITDQHILTELEKERLLSFTPSRQVLGRRFVCHDDRYILNLAAETGAIVVTNDNYRDLINEKPEFKKVIEERILMYSFANDRFMPPDDPLGRNGPTLDQFLRRRPSSSIISGSDVQQQQPCPYGKKCTYGNKCKFLHAERGNLPQKSVTDMLKAISSHKINEVRAREPSRDSSPGDPVTRTKSMQPRASNEVSSLLAQSNKELLCRTRSTFPQLSLHQPDQPIRPTQSASIWPPSRHQACHTSSLGLTQLHPSSSDPSKSFSSENVTRESNQLWPSTFSIGVTVGQFSPLPDTSVPPPIDSSNSHAKLARQLTLNPTFDPRIHHHRGSTPPSYPFPPPTMVQSFQPDHVTVTRIASAPEQIFALAANHPNKPNRHSHLQRMSSTSDSQLHKKNQAKWTNNVLQTTTAVSPLIGSSDGGVWGTNATSQQVDYSEVARSRLYYHLAALFPEEQVLRAMRALPEETDPQKICTYIICLNKQEMMQ